LYFWAKVRQAFSFAFPYNRNASVKIDLAL